MTAVAHRLAAEDPAPTIIPTIISGQSSSSATTGTPINHSILLLSLARPYTLFFLARMKASWCNFLPFTSSTVSKPAVRIISCNRSA
jgi:hypothetical protein